MILNFKEYTIVIDDEAFTLCAGHSRTDKVYATILKTMPLDDTILYSRF